MSIFFVERGIWVVVVYVGLLLALALGSVIGERTIKREAVKAKVAQWEVTVDDYGDVKTEFKWIAPIEK
jgi:hypothetical protein